jgi:hypothetical protein
MPVHCHADNFLEMLLPVSFELRDDKLDSLVGAWLTFVGLVLKSSK